MSGRNPMVKEMPRRVGRMPRWVFAGFGAVAVVMLVLQVIPATGVVLSRFFAPAWIGVLFQLLLFVVAVLALFRRVSSWLLMVPLAVWGAGVAYWLVETAAIRSRLAQAPSALALPSAVDDVVFVNNLPTPLAHAMVGMYELKSATIGPLRYRFGGGAECSVDGQAPRPVARPWSPPFLKALQQSVVAERVAPPVDGYDIFSHSVPGDFRVFSIADQPLARTARFDIIGRGANKPFKASVSVQQEYPPLPVVVPLLGCDYSSGKRNCFAGILRSPVLETGNPDHALTKTDWLENNAFYLAHALGLKRRAQLGLEVDGAKSF